MATTTAQLVATVNGNEVVIGEIFNGTIDLVQTSDHAEIAMSLNEPILVDPSTNIILRFVNGSADGDATACVHLKTTLG